MNQVLEKFNLPRLTKGEINNLIWSMPTMKIESIKYPSKTAPGLDGFSEEFYPRFKNDITPILCNFWQKLETEEILPNSFYEAQNYLNTIRPGQRKENQKGRQEDKTDKDKKVKLQTSLSHEHRCKNLVRNIHKSNSTLFKNNYTPWPRGIYSRYARLVQYLKIN